ncbi:MAG: methyltransferase family protein [Promethearchaeota archaeon]
MAFACYCAWYNIWPIFKLSTNLFHHLALFTFGLIPSFIGLIIYFLYLGKMGSFPRAIGRNADELITDGIFSITRNPQSLGRGIGLIGIGIMGRSNFTLFLALSWILFNHFHIRIEEKHLEDKFGESYLQYCASTPRYYKIIRKN